MAQSVDNYGVELDASEFDSYLRGLSERQLFDQMDFEIRDMGERMDYMGLARIEQVWNEHRRRILGVG